MFLDIDKWPGQSIAAIDISGSELSYGELCGFSELFSRVVSHRTLIFILSENDIGALSGYIASLSARIVPALINASIEPGLLERLIMTYLPEYLWIPDKIVSNFKGEIILNKYKYSLLRTGYNVPDMYDELSLLLNTSGSTGSPKLVRHSYRNLQSSAKNVSSFFKLDCSERPAAALPMNYTMGLSVINSHLFSGATILLYNGSLMDKAFWAYFKEYRGTSFTGVPHSFEILNKLRFFKMLLPDLRVISQGGGRMREELFIQCAEYASSSGKKFYATYGQTEGTARMSYLDPDMALKKTCSIGKAIPEGRFYLVDDNGNVILEDIASGELVYEGPNVTLGYALLREDLLKGDQNFGILKTGDLACRDSEGYYFITGRLSRFLKLYGTRISLDEIERIVQSNFSIDCYCTGNDECMRVYIDTASLKEQTLDFLVKKTGLFHGAFEVIVIDQIPRNEAGKMLIR